MQYSLATMIVHAEERYAKRKAAFAANVKVFMENVLLKIAVKW